MAGIKKFNWVNRPKTWQYVQAWRAQRKAMTERFLDESSSTSSAFVNAQNNLSVGMATLAAQASIQRTQDAINAARNNFSSVAGSVNKLV